MPRKYPDDDGKLWLNEGEYGKDPRDGQWYCRPPGVHMGCLRGHNVVEHEDGTITVSPSILVTEYDDDCKIEYHGFLEKGEWQSC